MLTVSFRYKYLLAFSYALYMSRLKMRAECDGAQPTLLVEQALFCLTLSADKVIKIKQI